MAAFYNWPQQKIDLLFLSFSALAIIFLFCHCFASEALFWLYQMHLELKVYSLPAKIFFSLHWGYTLVINSGFPVCVTLSKEETWRSGVTTGQDTSEQNPKTCCRKQEDLIYNLWCCQGDNFTWATFRSCEALESLGKESLQTSRNRFHRTSTAPVGILGGPSCPQALWTFNPHCQAHREPIYGSQVPLSQAMAQTGCKHFLNRPSGMLSDYKTILRSYLL